MSKLRLGKYFIIHSKHNFNWVLEVGDDGESESVKLAEMKPDWMGNNDHQLWYYNPSSKILFNKKNNLCLEFSGGKLWVTKCKVNDESQHWTLENNWIVNVQLNRVIEVTNHHECTLADKNEHQLNQLWKIENLPALYFYIKLKSKPSLTVDVRGEDAKPGAKVIVYENKGKLSDNQLWWEDENGIIRSKLNDFAFDLTDKMEVIMNPYQHSNPSQQWVVSRRHLRNVERPGWFIYMKPGSLLTGPPRLMACETLVGIDDDVAEWQLEFIEHQSISLNHSGCGRNFSIRSQLNGGVLQVDGEDVGAGSKVVLKKFSGEDTNRTSRLHFYEDDVTGTIRSILRNFAIEATDSGLILSSYDPYKKLQQWQCKSHRIQNRHNLTQLIQVQRHHRRNNSHPAASDDGGNESGDDDSLFINVGEDVNGLHQLWDFCYVPARCFQIVSIFCQKVIDVRGCKSDSGASVILYDKNHPATNNQLWYEDERGLVRSKLNGYVLDSSGPTMKVTPYDPTNPDHHWIIVGDRIQNKFDHKSVIDISGENKWNGTSLIKYKFHGGENQRWKFEYVD
ncbi:hypothetical protein HELRODRAFT_191325 [Helobdella robusta]|uniref:Ricin B lectin domain-containing protein n=1 Tax=Helobdella robusta TaxID=6412 RepID=T1FSW0_HELRO|nr:hypothetical protein HELRODRAFT_191325 [Helobdella robusta]ESO05534.1 hypothetical protein HELRODRAFT_191325 [Helobdella robusta]